MATNSNFIDIQYVTGPVKTGHICTNYTPLENGIYIYIYIYIYICVCVCFLVADYDKHILYTVSAFTMICQCIMKISVTYLNWFKSFGELKLKI